VKSDQRSYQLTLTPAGEAMLRRLTACAERHERELDRVIGARDRAKFLSLLKKIRSELGSWPAPGPVE
jgi:DNA-binding MarR family transcriptional regulator